MSVFLTPDDTHDLCVGTKSMRALFSREWNAFIVSLFPLGKAPLSFVPFLERIGAIICPPLLGSSRCWGSEETEFAAIADGACERVWERNFSSYARQRLTRVNCGRKMYRLLHLLILQEVLCWLMVGWWRRRGYFWAFSACLPRDVELLEVMKRALLLGRPTVEAQEKGEWFAVDLMNDLYLA